MSTAVPRAYDAAAVVIPLRPERAGIGRTARSSRRVENLHTVAAGVDIDGVDRFEAGDRA